MTTVTTRYRIHPLPADFLAEVRANDCDGLGHPVVRLTATGGEPLRCCLRDAVAGEPLILFGYQPPLPASPYREIGPVFAHAEPCDPGPEAGYPTDWYGRPQVLRAYDDRGWIHPATRLHDGHDPDAAIAAVLAEPGVVQVHSRNVAYGCFMFIITRDD